MSFLRYFRTHIFFRQRACFFKEVWVFDWSLNYNLINGWPYQPLIAFKTTSNTFVDIILDTMEVEFYFLSDSLVYFFLFIFLFSEIPIGHPFFPIFWLVIHWTKMPTQVIIHQVWKCFIIGMANIVFSFEVVVHVSLVYVKHLSSLEFLFIVLRTMFNQSWMTTSS